MVDIADVSPGDVITSARANLVNDYIQDGTHKLNTLSVDIGGVEVIASKTVIKLTGGTSGTVTVQAAAEAGTWSLTLPTSDGDDGNVLTTNGSGVTSWAAASGGASMVYERLIEGDVYTTTLMPITVPDSLIGLDIGEVRICLSSLPTGAAFKVDVRKNGTASTNSIFTSDTEIEIGTAQAATNGLYITGCDSSGATVGTPGTTIDSAVDTLAADDVLFVVITQVGSTLAGTDFVCTVSVG